MSLVRNVSGSLVDALPYVDQQYEDELTKKQVDKLIEDEMRSFKPTRDYLAELPLPVPDLKDFVFVNTEQERIRAGKPMTPMDTTRYQMDPPPATKRSDLGAWRQAVSNAQSQLEHQYLRLVNLELLNKYGANTWRAYNSDIESAIHRLESLHKAHRAHIEQINRDRSSEQLSTGSQLAELESKWQELIQKNLEIETACFLLQRDITYLKSVAKARGVLKEGEEAIHKAGLAAPPPADGSPAPEGASTDAPEPEPAPQEPATDVPSS